MMKPQNKNSIMTCAEAGRLGAAAQGKNVGVTYIIININKKIKDELTKRKGNLSYSKFVAKLLGVEYGK